MRKKMQCYGIASTKFSVFILQYVVYLNRLECSEKETTESTDGIFVLYWFLLLDKCSSFFSTEQGRMTNVFLIIIFKLSVSFVPFLAEPLSGWFWWEKAVWRYSCFPNFSNTWNRTWIILCGNIFRSIGSKLFFLSTDNLWEIFYRRWFRTCFKRKLLRKFIHPHLLDCVLSMNNTSTALCTKYTVYDTRCDTANKKVPMWVNDEERTN